MNCEKLKIYNKNGQKIKHLGQHYYYYYPSSFDFCSF